MVVLVSGAKGQLGQALQFISGNYPEVNFVFCDSSQLDITNFEQCEAVFNTYKPNFCINAAAYTAVDKAESEPDRAFDINTNGAQNLAAVCKAHQTVLIHVSTDFVFDAYYANGIAYYDREKRLPLKSALGLTETDVPFPSGVYGLTKLQGEQAIQNTWNKYFIVRTSWVYSEFANNFMKTMLRLATERDSLSVVADQIGTPTYAVDLAKVLMTIVMEQNTNLNDDSKYGIYNFSNEGQCSWYEFAAAIFELSNIKIDLQPIPSSAYPTPAKRPAYSVLDKTKIKNNFGVEVQNWKQSLANCLAKL
jgi:dTDP-4-dehydrorhamnose reductase